MYIYRCQLCYLINYVYILNEEYPYPPCFSSTCNHLRAHTHTQTHMYTRMYTHILAHIFVTGMPSSTSTSVVRLVNSRMLACTVSCSSFSMLYELARCLKKNNMLYFCHAMYQLNELVTTHTHIYNMAACT